MSITPCNVTRIKTKGFTWVSRRRERDAARRLVCGIWGLKHEDPAAYVDHYRDLLTFPVNPQLLTKPSPEDVFKLVNLLRSKSQSLLQDVKDDIRVLRPNWILDWARDDGIKAAVDLAVRIWLFTTPTLEDDNLTLGECVLLGVPRRDQQLPIAPCQSLSPDFSEKSLTRKGGMKVVWTSNLEEHLTFETNRLRIFRHSSALRRFDDSSSQERHFYPPNFLRETEVTMELLLRPNELESPKRIARLAKRGPADLEPGINKSAPLDLTYYPTWGYRLLEVQKRYDAAKPVTLEQWYYDRRNKPEWATFWVAVVVFILTVFLG